MSTAPTYAAFADATLIASAPLAEMLAAVKRLMESGEERTVLIFENQTGKQVDFDFRGSLADVLEKASPRPAPRKPGRPSLGVESREVSLLPRHWAWLQEQPSGASAALRRLVEEASKQNSPQDRLRRAREAAYGIMSALAGNRPGFEEATRALFAGDRPRLAKLIKPWPADLRKHLCALLDEGGA